MGHLTKPTKVQRVTEVEIVSDDSQKVLNVSVSDHGVVTISMRDATESPWSANKFATLDKSDAAVVALIFGGGHVYSGSTTLSTVEGLSSSAHELPKPESEKAMGEGDCTPLDVERAKAANLKEQRQLVELELERDHARDLHVTADVPGCPACDRKVAPAEAFDRSTHTITATYDGAKDDPEQELPY